MRRLLVLLAASLAAMLVSTAGAQAAAPAPSGDSLRFDLQAGSGTLDRVGDSRTRYVLTLRGVAPQTSWSSLDPVPNGGSIRTAQLAARWKRLGLVASPPQAVLALLNGRRSADAFAFSLRPPAYDAARRTLRFRVVAEPTPPERLAYLGPQLDPARELRFGPSALFVDNGYVAPVGTGYDAPTCNYIGQVEQFPAHTRTEAYQPADGREVSIGKGTYAQFAVIGDAFGGDGRTTFKLPTVAPGVAGLEQRVCMDGTFPTRDDTWYAPDPADCSAGSIVLNAGSFVPYGWLPANGGSVDRDRYSTLFAAIGTRFGAENERTFRVPTVAAPAGLRYLVCASGAAPNPTRPGQVCTVGQVTLFATAALPANYLPADGSTVDIRGHQNLFSVAGSTFGGNGQTSFQTPRLASPTGTAWGICDSGPYPR